jgi:hypothetical protein
MSVPRLGVASVIVEISDAEGFTVRHGSSKELIFKKSAKECTDEWTTLFECFEQLAGHKNLLA